MLLDAAPMTRRQKKRGTPRLGNEVECADCGTQARCWTQPLAPGGIRVRRHMPLARGELLFQQGAAFEAPYVVTSGCFALREILENGGERIVSFRVPGQLLGFEGSSSGFHPHSAEAIAPSTVCRLQWNAAGLSDRSAPMLRQLLAKTTDLLQRSSHPWAGLPAMERVRVFVEDFLARSNQSLPMTRAEIGLHLGLAEETVVRALAKLSRR